MNAHNFKKQRVQNLCVDDLEIQREESLQD